MSWGARQQDLQLQNIKNQPRGFQVYYFLPLCTHFCLPFQAKLAFQCYSEGYHAISEGVSIYVNFIFFHKNATEHVTRYENICMDIWYTGVLVYWCTALLVQKRNPI